MQKAHLRSQGSEGEARTLPGPVNFSLPGNGIKLTELEGWWEIFRTKYLSYLEKVELKG